MLIRTGFDLKKRWFLLLDVHWTMHMSLWFLNYVYSGPTWLITRLYSASNCFALRHDSSYQSHMGVVQDFRKTFWSQILQSARNLIPYHVNFVFQHTSIHVSHMLNKFDLLVVFFATFLFPIPTISSKHVKKFHNVELWTYVKYFLHSFLYL